MINIFKKYKLIGFAIVFIVLHFLLIGSLSAKAIYAAFPDCESFALSVNSGESVKMDCIILKKNSGYN